MFFQCADLNSRHVAQLGRVSVGKVLLKPQSFPGFLVLYRQQEWKWNGEGDFIVCKSDFILRMSIWLIWLTCWLICWDIPDLAIREVINTTNRGMTVVGHILLLFLFLFSHTSVTVVADVTVFRIQF